MICPILKACCRHEWYQGYRARMLWPSMKGIIHTTHSLEWFARGGSRVFWGRWNPWSESGAFLLIPEMDGWMDVLTASQCLNGFAAQSVRWCCMTCLLLPPVQIDDSMLTICTQPTIRLLISSQSTLTSNLASIYRFRSLYRRPLLSMYSNGLVSISVQS